jgi:hypothetical protein
MTVAQSETVTDASSSTVSDVLTLDHESTAAGTNFGTALLFSAHDSSTASIGMGEIQSIWTNATHNSNVSKFVFHLNNGSTAFVTPATLTGGGIFDVSSGYTIGAAAQSGYILQGDGTKYTKSTSTWPTTAVGAGSKIVVSDGTNFIMSSATYPGTSGSGKMIQSDGTNWVASTATWPTTNTAGYYVMSNGTNYLDYPADLENTSVASVSAGYSADTYLTGSTITIAAGDFKVNGVYHCKFDMTKTAAGTATPIITLRMGTAGTTSDAAIGTLTFGAGTAVADTGIFDVDVVFRTVGGGTSAVVQIMGECGHLLAATGMTSTGAAGTAIILATSSGFASTTQTKIGLSFNGGTSFSGTNTLVTASLHQP